MTIIRTIAVVATAAALLTGCSSTTTTSQAPTTTTAPMSTSATPTGPEKLQLGETAHLVQDAKGPREIDVTIDSVDVSADCFTRPADYADDYPDKGGYYLLIKGEIDAKATSVTWALDSSDLSGTGADGYEIQLTDTPRCDSIRDDSIPGYQSFGHTVAAGQKLKDAMQVWVQEVPAMISLEQPYEPVTYAWELPKA